MSKELAETSAFTGEGFESMPNTYVDMKKLEAISELPDQFIDDLMSEYNAYITRPNIMPRARDNSRRILTYLAFEKAWRGGVFEKAPDDLKGLEGE